MTDPDHTAMVAVRLLCEKHGFWQVTAALADLMQGEADAMSASDPYRISFEEASGLVGEASDYMQGE